MAVVSLLARVCAVLFFAVPFIRFGFGVVLRVSLKNFKLNFNKLIAEFRSIGHLG